jgi:glycerol-3-phosphate dehydrogenase (NAD(P)+)
MSRIAIIGAGAWGTALAIVAARKGHHDVRLWAYEQEVRDAISASGENSQFLPGQTLPRSVAVSGNFATVLADAQIVICAVPSQHCRRIIEQLSQHLRPEMHLISAAKGLEQTTLLRMTEVVSQVTGGKYPVGAISGPTFALEVARGDPTALTIASEHKPLMAAVQRELSDTAFRIYSNDDVVGVELGGALKNIIAIAAGICDGLGLGHNSAAALITRGLAEITRLVCACGGRSETMAGLAGLGDLVLTCTGALSRNRSVGVELGRGRKLPDIVAGMHGMIAEGVFTTDAAVQLSQSRGVEMPITEQMHAILNQGKPPREAIHELMTRSSKSESQASEGTQQQSNHT